MRRSYLPGRPRTILSKSKNCRTGTQALILAATVNILPGRLTCFMKVVAKPQHPEYTFLFTKTELAVGFFVFVS